MSIGYPMVVPAYVYANRRALTVDRGARTSQAD